MILIIRVKMTTTLILVMLTLMKKRMTMILMMDYEDVLDDHGHDGLNHGDEQS